MEISESTSFDATDDITKEALVEEVVRLKEELKETKALRRGDNSVLVLILCFSIATVMWKYIITHQPIPKEDRE